ncbi:hypothetical protein AAKU52_003025 [Pedobacter sp. CG_S7]|uniref:hypothetical protein n=1 Tax=Pedobacter sp. CG_S7 TaxID=3143930 RepID=UPI00339B27DC
MHKNILAGGFFLLFMGCGNTEQQQKVPQKYFDLKDYFLQEATRLNKTNPIVLKTVALNNASESKQLPIEDWNKELANFSDADINKSAWQGFFSVVKNDQKEVYTSDNDKVAVKELTVIHKNSKISGIKILLKTSNYLYQSTDTLSYFPDSLYEIRKTQKIRLLNAKKYNIKGVF